MSDRTPTRPPARPLCRSMPRRPSRRNRPAGTRVTITLAAAIRPGRCSETCLAGALRGASGRSPSPQGWPRPPRSFRPWARRRGGRRGRSLWRHVSPAGTRFQAVGAGAALHGRRESRWFRQDHQPGHQARLDRNADQSTAANHRYRRDRRDRPQPGRLAGRGQYLCVALFAAADRARGRPGGSQHDQISGGPFRRDRRSGRRAPRLA